jgi:uncharacterized protein YceK
MKNVIITLATVVLLSGCCHTNTLMIPTIEDVTAPPELLLKEPEKLKTIRQPEAPTKTGASETTK